MVGTTIKIRNRSDQLRGFFMRLANRPMLVTTLMMYLLIILFAGIYLSRAPEFSSDMTMILPGSGSSSQFAIEDVGQASAQTRAPFSGAGFSPRVNYKEILRSAKLTRIVADHLSIDNTKLSKPIVKLTEQTSFLSVSVSAASANAANKNAWLYYEAFQLQLDELRADEAKRHASGISKVMAQYEATLSDTRLALLKFQRRSLLVNEDQLAQETTRLSTLKEKRMYAVSELKRRDQFVKQLSQDLGVSPLLAGRAFILNTDAQFRGFLRELDDSAAQVSRFKSHWGRGHPKVKAEQSRMDEAKRSLLMRSIWLVGEQSANVLHTMDLKMSSGRAQLFSDLVENFAALKGDQAKIDALVIAEEVLEEKIKIYVRESMELGRLNADIKLAQAVYTSAAAKLDAAKADVFASYPVVQLLSQPSIPEQQRSPKLYIAVAAVIVGFVFITLGGAVVWQRQYLLNLLLKRD